MYTSEELRSAIPEPKASDELAESIRTASLKVTAPRVAVLAALSTSPHATAEKLFAAVRVDLPGTSLQAVYGVLAAFTTAGLVRKIEPAGSAALFERRVGDNHHHLVCTRCSVVHDVDCSIGSSPCLVPDTTLGFVIHSAEVTYWGLCPACQADLTAEMTAHTEADHA